MSETQRLEKKDGRGSRWTATYARTVIEAWKASGQSAIAFAAQHGIHASRLSYWSKQLEQCQDPAAATFVAVPMQATQAIKASAAIEIELDGSVTLRVPEGADTRYVVQLVAALRSQA